MTAPHKRKPPECDWLCGRLLRDLPVVVELNGGRGCWECANWVREAVEGPDALPFNPPLRWYRVDPMTRFLKRLGRAATRRGIDPKALARALDEARP
jgi:hypothetical protein